MVFASGKRIRILLFTSLVALLDILLDVQKGPKKSCLKYSQKRLKVASAAQGPRKAHALLHLRGTHGTGTSTARPRGEFFFGGFCLFGPEEDIFFSGLVCLTKRREYFFVWFFMVFLRFSSGEKQLLLRRWTPCSCSARLAPGFLPAMGLKHLGQKKLNETQRYIRKL